MNDTDTEGLGIYISVDFDIVKECILEEFDYPEVSNKGIQTLIYKDVDGNGFDTKESIECFLKDFIEDVLNDDRLEVYNLKDHLDHFLFFSTFLFDLGLICNSRNEHAKRLRDGAALISRLAKLTDKAASSPELHKDWIITIRDASGNEHSITNRFIIADIIENALKKELSLQADSGTQFFKDFISNPGRTLGFISLLKGSARYKHRDYKKEAQAKVALILLRYLNKFTSLHYTNEIIVNSQVSMSVKQGEFLYRYLDYFSGIEVTKRVDRVTDEVQTPSSFDKSIRTLINNYLKLSL